MTNNITDRITTDAFQTFKRLNNIPDNILKGEEKMIKNDSMKNINKIVITRDEDDDNKVICRAFTNDGGLIRYDATCSPDDIFDFNIGAKLAMDRLYEGYDMTPKPKRKLYTGMIFIARYPGRGLKDNTLSAAICFNVYGDLDDVAKCSAYFIKG